MITIIMFTFTLQNQLLFSVSERCNNFTLNLVLRIADVIAPQGKLWSIVINIFTFFLFIFKFTHRLHYNIRWDKVAPSDEFEFFCLDSIIIFPLRILLSHLPAVTSVTHGGSWTKEGRFNFAKLTQQLLAILFGQDSFSSIDENEPDKSSILSGWPSSGIFW